MILVFRPKNKNKRLCLYLLKLNKQLYTYVLQLDEAEYHNRWQKFRHFRSTHFLTRRFRRS